jgi:hypothetical protein
VIDFYAPWCVACTEFRPAFRDLSVSPLFGDFHFCVVNGSNQIVRCSTSKLYIELSYRDSLDQEYRRPDENCRRSSTIRSKIVITHKTKQFPTIWTFRDGNEISEVERDHLEVGVDIDFFWLLIVSLPYRIGLMNIEVNRMYYSPKNHPKILGSQRHANRVSL